MKRSNKIILGFFCALSVVFQIIFFINRQVLYEFGFAVGLGEKAESGLDILLLYLLVPLVFIVFFLSGSIHSLTHGYGKLLIIRNYSKTKLFLKNRLKSLIAVAVITVYQAVVYIPFNSTMLPLKDGIVQSLIMYFLVLNLIITAQGVLELYIAPHIANIVLFCYSYVSCFLVQSFKLSAPLRILMFPSLMFGTLNSSVTFDNTYYLYLISTILITAILIFIGIYKFKKTDIF
jgi:hypothetical protein